MKSDCYPLFVYPYGLDLDRGEHTLKIQLSQQAKEVLGKSALVIITERVDDVALLIGQMVTMGLPEVLDRHIPRHWKKMLSGADRVLWQSQ